MEKINTLGIRGITSNPISVKEPIDYSKVAKDVNLENYRVWIGRRCKTPVVTANAEVNTLLVELRSQATEVSSADEIRQSIKSAMNMKTVMVKYANENMNTAITELIPVSDIQEYKPESGDQIHVPQKARKRRGKPTRAGPTKRPRTRSQTMNEFYVGKLSNICTGINKLTTSELAFAKRPRPLFPKPNYGYIWKKFFGYK